MGKPTFGLGIEEEYFLVDKNTRELVVDPPARMMAECRTRLGGQVGPEFFRCQIEVATEVAGSLVQAREDLARLRSTVAACAADDGLAPVACGLHPFSDWNLQLNTDEERYRRIADDLQVPGRRLVTCGLHVHVAVDEAERFDLLNQAAYFLPYFLALSTSSPFRRGAPTGMCSYRLSVLGETPRTGRPPSFSSVDEYNRVLKVLVAAGLVPDATYFWWDIRPSAKYPTLELRVADACARIDDGIAIAALYRCTIRMLSRVRAQNVPWRSYSPFLLDENRWLAQRFGRSAALVDPGKGTMVPFAALVDEWLGLIAEDAAFFGCEREVARARSIVSEGTSAERQLIVYEAMIAGGAPAEEALRAVVDHLIEETVASCSDDKRPTSDIMRLVGKRARTTMPEHPIPGPRDVIGG